MYKQLTQRDIYLRQIVDLYSANTQALEAVIVMQKYCDSDHLRLHLQRGTAGIERGRQFLTTLTDGSDYDPKSNISRGMQGLVLQAKSAIEECKFRSRASRHSMIIQHYRSLNAYAMSGFQSAALFASCFGHKSAHQELEKHLASMASADERLEALAREFLEDSHYSVPIRKP